MIQIKKYLLEKIAVAQTMTVGNVGGASNNTQPEDKEYMQKSLTDLDGAADSVQVSTQQPPPIELTNHQKDYMMNARDRIDEMRRYHQGSLHYDKNKYTSKQWSDYINGLVKDPMYAKVTADGVTDEQLQGYQREMANKDLANFRKKFEAVDPNHEMLQKTQDIQAGQYSNYEWEDDATYRKNRGLESEYKNGVYLPKQYTAADKAKQKAFRQSQQQDFIDRYQRQDRPKANTISSVNANGTKTEWKYDNKGNRKITTTNVNIPKPVNTDNVYWQSFTNGTNPQVTALLNAKAQQAYRYSMEPEIGKAYDYFVQKGHIPDRFLPGGRNELRPGTAGFEGAIRFRNQQWNHMYKNNPDKLKQNPYIPSYMSDLMRYNDITAGAANNQDRAKALINHTDDPLGIRNNLIQK